MNAAMTATKATKQNESMKHLAKSFCCSLTSQRASCEYTARMRLPPVESGLIPATVAAPTMPIVISITPGIPLPSCCAIRGSVGISVGNTTPFAELNH